MGIAYLDAHYPRCRCRVVVSPFKQGIAYEDHFGDLDLEYISQFMDAVRFINPRSRIVDRSSAAHLNREFWDCLIQYRFNPRAF